jgi:hypothetical protein
MLRLFAVLILLVFSASPVASEPCIPVTAVKARAQADGLPFVLLDAEQTQRAAEVFNNNPPPTSYSFNVAAIVMFPNQSAMMLLGNDGKLCATGNIAAHKVDEVLGYIIAGRST